MRCAKCQTENLADAKFCQDCGAALELLCAACQTLNQPGSKFCRDCGSRLGAPTPVATPAPAPEHAVPKRLAERFRQGHSAHLAQHADERKIITALFADIKGSMALLDDMDPELARQVIDPALRLMMDAVHRYEGYVAQSLGDGIFALFGAPIAREDHARRAVYAALAMQQQMKEYGVRLLREHGLAAMQIRVGINTGEVVVRSIATDAQRADYVPVGHSTGLANRIENIAAPGSVLVSESTHRLTEGYFEFRALGNVPMKGVSAGVNLFEVTGIGPLRTRLEVSASHGLARFVGRQEELQRMLGLLQLAKAGQGQIIGVMGEAGVGKSRLCHEFKQLARDGCLVLECSSDSYGKAFPYLPLIDLLKNYLRIAPGDDERRIVEKTTGRLLALDRGLDEAIPFLLALLGVEDPATPINRMDPNIRRLRSFNAIEQLLLREARKQPLLLVFEDLHWLDQETQSFLTQLGRAVAGAPILLLVNYRPEYSSAWDSSTSHSQLRLNAFGAADAESLLAGLLGTGPALEGLKRLIIEKTQGNPFFMEEYVQTLFDQGVLLRGEKVELTQALSEIKMPVTVQGVLAARIDRLAPQEKSFLQMLAVLGAASPLRLIERLEQCPAQRLGEILTRLQSGEFIFERPAFPDVEYVFKHALTRETAYGELLQDARRGLHSQAAQAIEAHFSDQLDEHCSELAHHYASSDNPPKAVDFLRRAAAQAMQRSAYALALGHLELALTMLPGLPEVQQRDALEMRLRSMQGAALMATRGFAAPGVGQAYERARELCNDTTSAADLVRVLPGLGLLYINRGDLQLARGIGGQLLELAERRQDMGLYVAGHAVLGLALLRSGDLAECRRHMQSAVQRYEALDDGPQRDALRDSLGGDPAVTCLGFGAMALWLLGYPDQALAGAAQALRAAHAAKVRHPFSLAYALLSSVWVRQFRGEARLAQQEAQAATEFATLQGFPSWLSHSLVVLGWSEAEQGQAAQGAARVEQALPVYEASGAKVWTPLFMLLQSRALAQAGKTGAALESATRALELAQAIGPYWWEAELHRARGELLLERSMEQAGQARACFEQALRIARSQGAKSLELRACASLARLALRPNGQGDPAQARAELSSVHAWFTEGLDSADLVEARELIGPR